jgi:methylmalonyl-CoA mutase C-terminal domain/subunit
VSRALPRVVLAELEGCSEEGSEGKAVPLARALRDAGVEVVYAGRLRTCAQVTSTVEQEDPDALGLTVDAATDPALLAELAAALPSVRVFGWGTGAAGPLDRVFSEETQVTEWLAGGATHTVSAPSDRIR